MQIHPFKAGAGEQGNKNILPWFTHAQWLRFKVLGIYNFNVKLHISHWVWLYHTKRHKLKHIWLFLSFPYEMLQFICLANISLIIPKTD